MNLGEVLSKAWKIIWKNKILWIFGILASCGRGGGGGGGGSNTNFSGNGSDNDFFNNDGELFSDGQFPGADQLNNFMDNIFGGGGEEALIPIIIGLLCLFLIIAVVFIFLGTIGRIGLIKGTMMADNGQEPLSFGQVWSVSTPYFWRVFLLNLVIGLAVGLAFIVLLIPMVFISIATLGIGLLCLIPIICLLIPISWAINVITEQANVAMVVEELGIMAAIKRGWQVSRENLGPMAVVALVVLVGGGIVGFIVALPLVLAVVPLIIGVIAEDESAIAGALTTSAILVCCMLPFVIALSGVLQSYISAVWTLTFRRLTDTTQSDIDVLDVSDLQSV